MLPSVRDLKDLIGVILIIGALISIAVVSIGAVWYLLENGAQHMQHIIFQPETYQLTVLEVLRSMLKPWTPIVLIELGLIILIATQILRVLLLAIYYTLERDIYFAPISIFILLLLLYSFLLRR